MSSDWRETTLGEFSPFKYGKGLPERDRKPGNISVYSSAGIVGKHNAACVQNAGVVIGRKGTVGSVYYSPSSFWPIDTAFYVDDVPESRDIRYTYYLLKTLGLEHMNTDSAVPGLNRENAHALRITVPTLSVQKQIADFLVLLDDRITLLRETNATLEAIAQAIFKSWFVDFDPVLAKADGKQPEGMDAAMSALFPSSFEETELGLVPRGWVIDQLKSIAKLKGGKMLDKDAFDDTALNPVFGGAGVMGRSNVSNADGFVMTVGRVGAYCGQFFWHIGKAWINNNASLISANESKFSTWIYLWLRNVDIERIKKGAAQPFVSNGDIEALEIKVPDKDVLCKFVEIVDPMFLKMAANESQARDLVLLRDALLPRLISGKLHLTDEEIKVA